jgi:flagellar basal body-associated protein FliL
LIASNYVEATNMSEEQASQSKWNWIAIWWYLVVSLCGATIAAHSMGQKVMEMLSQAARPEDQQNIAMMREQFDIIVNVADFASLVVLLISGFLIPKFYGPVQKR